MSQNLRHRRASSVWTYVLPVVLALTMGALLVLTERETDVAAGEPEVAEHGGVAVVGDSHTEMDSLNFAAGRIGDQSWVSTLISEGYRFAGGWAVAGATSTLQAESFRGVMGADVMIVMTGTNDLVQGVPFDQTASSLEAIVAKAPADRVLVLAIPPLEQEVMPTSGVFNESLRELAEDRGWEYFDGFEFLRSPDGGFVEGMTYDGIHLTPEAQERFGAAVVEYLGRETDS
ncbi:SGNH/GDSL hydrolase family protein [Nesterenkonia sp. Act20]|uniref:SGNH/GDSL hydrolase family protein n=1 Tax=Nesterenkonia sp. Act20 TaxID=1483432 RepID=UPI001C48D139|nr:SGNH/GDSL hydrolase family protein [Nesterenkonia sp. Act20]